ncbi:MAG: endonuclease III [Deltaproteobacteria bacterium]|nr:endonuclease III [Deltaproteobacteria bacterium]
MARNRKSPVPEKRAGILLGKLKEAYPDAGCTLGHDSPFNLLVATILSAQCTDERVNQVTKHLFTKYKGPKAFAEADIDELMQDIKSTGFYKNKARSIKECSRELVEKYNGEVPAEMDALVKLRGVGRKTANVVLGTWFNIPAITVDTHVKRLAGRLGLSREKDPGKIEQDLMNAFPRDSWVFLSHALILHGRQICKARKPLCGRCLLATYCPSRA